MTAALVHYENACRELAEAHAIDEVKTILDKTVAIEVYARQARNRDLEVSAAKIRFRAERRLGELEGELHREGRIHRGGRPRADDSETGSREEPVSQVRLADIGVDKKLSSRAQRLAALPAHEFDGLLNDLAIRAGAETQRITRDLFKAREKAARRAEFTARTADGCTVDDLAALVDARRTFGAILADPPWLWRPWSAKGADRSPGYRTDPLAEIAALPVQKLAAKDCALFVWVVWPMLREALDLIDAWGFDYKTCGLAWMKQNPSGEGLFLGQGYWTRANSEVCLLATRGAPTRLDAGVPQAILAPVREHSQKPDEVHERVERLVAGPYLELYARSPREGWTAWGNEIERAKFAPSAAANPPSPSPLPSPRERGEGENAGEPAWWARARAMRAAVPKPRLIDIATALGRSVSSVNYALDESGAARAKDLARNARNKARRRGTDKGAAHVD